jgi:hypothetical protein
MPFTAWIEAIHMTCGRQFRELNIIPSRSGGLHVVARDLNRQSLVCGAVNDQLLHA